jgi:hypothetical protein
MLQITQPEFKTNKDSTGYISNEQNYWKWISELTFNMAQTDYFRPLIHSCLSHWTKHRTMWLVNNQIWGSHGGEDDDDVILG